jgi:hypothetical protein
MTMGTVIAMGGHAAPGDPTYRVRCTVGGHVAHLLPCPPYAASWGREHLAVKEWKTRAAQVVRGWGSPGFEGATFALLWSNGEEWPVTYPNLAVMFGLRAPKARSSGAKPAKPAAAPAPTVPRIPAAKPHQRPPTGRAAPAPPDTPPTPLGGSQSQPGRRAVRKEILHRGRPMTVTYWVKAVS